jgi:hypothetical protein
MQRRGRAFRRVNVLVSSVSPGSHSSYEQPIRLSVRLAGVAVVALLGSFLFRWFG